MTSWDYQKIVRLLETYAGSDDETDPKERKRLRIVRGAAELFIQYGYRKTSVDDIATRAGVAKGTVYLYFKNKSEILIQAIAREKQQYLSQIAPVFKEGLAPRDRLDLYLRTVFVLGTRMPLTAKLLSGDMEILTVLEEMDADLRDKSFEMNIDLLSGLIAEAAAPGTVSPEVLRERARVGVGLIYCSGLFAEEKIRGELSVERFTEVLAETISYGICESDTPLRSSKSKRRTQ
jgi:AcrR family transcriptional regulator